MLYNQYREKMLRLATVLGVARRFRVLIISVVLSIVALLACFFALCGLVYDVDNCPDSITFGDEFNYGANAVFNSVTYEFTPADKEEWTTVKPTRPGEYLVRTYSHGAFGNPRYGKTHAFTIVPRIIDVRIADTEIIYGEKPALSAETCYKDVLTCSGFIYADKSAPYTSVRADINSITVTDEHGNDVTNSYNFNIIGSAIRFKKRGLDIIFADYVTDYAGEVLTYKTYEISDATPIAEGDTEVVADMNFGPDVGVGELQPEIKIFSDGGKTDVTANYEINVIFDTEGTFTINKRPLYITTGSAETVYDGKSFSCRDYVLDEECQGFLDRVNHRFEIVSSTAVKDVKGEVDNLITKFAVYDKDGTDVSGNYVIVYKNGYGKIKVTPRRVVIQSADDSTQIFDGTPKTSLNFFTLLYSDSFEIAEGDRARVAESTFATFAGEYENVLSVKIYNSDGEDVSGNYALEYRYGTFRVMPRPLYIVTGNEEWVYDGEVHTHDEIVSEDGLIAGHHTETKWHTDAVDAGTVNNDMTLGVFDEEGNIVTENYDIRITPGSLTILPRPITIAPEYAEKVYDGTPLTSEKIIVVSEDYTIISGHSVHGEISGSQTDAGVVKSAVADLSSVVVKNENGEDISKNYKIVAAEEGDLKVTPRPISVKAVDLQKEYDGTPLKSGNDRTVTVSPRPVGNHNVVAEVEGEICEVGTAENIVTEVRILDFDDNMNDVTGNYEIERLNGELKVTPRALTVTTKDGRFVYNGADNSYDGHTCDRLVENHKTEAYDLEIISDVVQSGRPNDMKIRIFEEVDGEKVYKTENYAITYDIAGRLYMSPRPVTVLSGSAEKDYDARALYCRDYTVVSELGFLNGQTPVVTGYPKITDVRFDENGEVADLKNELTIEVFNAREEVTRNYEIECIPGELKINKRAIVFNTGSDSWVYDATAHICRDVEVENLPDHFCGLFQTPPDGVEDAVRIELRLTPSSEIASITNVGNKENRITGDIEIFRYTEDDGKYTNISKNFDMSFGEYGTLTVTKRPVTLKVRDAEKEYDGTPLPVNPKWVEFSPVGEEDAGLVGGTYGHNFDDVVFEEVTITDVGEVEINILSARIYDLDSEVYLHKKVDVTENYEITLKSGKLKITPREITITAGSDEKVYDGEALTCENYTVTRTKGFGGFALVSGHGVDERAIEYSGSQINAGTGKNTIVKESVKIYAQENGVKVDKTRNYNVTVAEGELKVKKRPVTVKTKSKTWFYDALMHSYLEYEVSETGTDEGIVTGQTHKADDTEGKYATVKNATTVYDFNGSISTIKVENEFSIIISDANGDTVTDNYEIEYVYGDLKVTPRHLFIITGSKELEYDGTPQSFKEISLKTDGISESSLYRHILVNNEELGIVHTLTAEGWATVTNVYDGEVKNTVSKITVYEKNNESEQLIDVTQNYYFVFTDDRTGIIKITPRKITVAADNDTKEYNGEEQFGEKFKTTSAGKPLVEGQKLVAETNEGGKNVGKYDITVKNSSAKIYASDEDGNIDKTKDESENYEISYDETKAVLEITPREIIVQTATNGWTYDGAKHSDGSWEVIEGALVSGHTKNSYNLTEVETVRYGENGEVIGYDNEMTATIWDGETEVTGNYNITYEWGTLTVKPRPVTVTAGSDSKIYDATPLTCGSYSFNEDLLNSGLLVKEKGHAISALTEGERIEVGSSDNVIKDDSVKIVDGEGKDVTANYKISTEKGTLTVTKRPLYVKTIGKEWIYDGKLHSFDGAVFEEPTENSGLVANHDARVDVRDGTYTEISEVGAWTKDESGNYAVEGVDNSRKILVYVLGTDTLVTDNYEITITEYGKLKILPRKLFVTTASNEEEWIYDGEIHYHQGYEVAASDDKTGLVAGHYTALEEVRFVVDAGSYSNDLKIKVLEENSKEVKTNDYDIIYDYGTLTIYPRPVTITTDSAEKPFDGTPLIHKIFMYDRAEFVKNHVIEAYDWASLTSVGEIDNSVSIEISDENGKSVTGNYFINLVLGTLKVTDSEGGGDIGGGDIGDIDEPGDGGTPRLALKIYSTEGGTIYLRYKSYGNSFDGRYFSEATDSGYLLDGLYSANYLSSLALKNSGAESATAKIKLSGSQYYLPYYMDFADGDYDIQTSDVIYTGDCEREYSVNYYTYDISKGTPSAIINSEFESEYSKYVHRNYLDTYDKETRDYLRGIIEREGFDINDPYVISKIAEYIQNAATYKMNYDPAISDGNVILNFLDVYKEGVCRHYARAATMLYRTLGLPARYCTGYMAKAEAGKWVEVTTASAHAWVEVYIDGFGWVQVEVTGFGNSGDGGGNLDENYPENSIVIKPADEYAIYEEGISLTAERLENNLFLNELSEHGYTFKAYFAGVQSGIGTSESRVTSFILYDPNGNNVTDEFSSRLVYETGELTVLDDSLYDKIIYVHAYSHSTYDGKEQYFDFSSLYVSDTADGYRVGGGYEVSYGISRNIGFTDAIHLDGAAFKKLFVESGLFNASVSLGGADVTARCFFAYDIDLEVSRINAVFATGSKTDNYEYGKTLSDPTCFLLMGSLAEGDEICVTGYTTLTEADEVENRVDFKIMRGDRDVTNNYYITKNYGTLTFTD